MKVIKGEKSGKNSEDAGETSVSKPASNRHVGRPSKSRSFSNQKADEFFKTLETARGKSLLICIKGYPDPDNIASSLSLEWLAQLFEIRTKIIYFDEISHHENRALVKKLDLDLEL